LILLLAAGLPACNLAAPSRLPEDQNTGNTGQAEETRRLPASPSPSPFPTLTATPSPGTFFQPDQPADTGYLLPLTIQFSSQDEVVAYFELEQPAVGYLFYRPDNVPQGEAEFLPLDAASSQHLLCLTGLMPDTRYQLDVGLEAADAASRPPSWRGEPWGSVFVHTLPEEVEHLRIGVIGDSGFGEPVTFALGSLMAETDLDFVIHTGDVVYSMEEQAGDPYLSYWLKYYLPFKPVLQQMVIYPVPGNHEYDHAALWQDLPFYYHAFPAFPGRDEGGIDGNRRWYALEIGTIQFLFLDSEDVFGVPGRSEMQAWLEERLQDKRFTTTIPVLHIPPFTSGIYAEESRVFEQLWHHLFIEADVPLVLSGHDHNYQRLEVDGITYLISGGGTTVLYAMQDEHPQNRFFRRVSHYVLLDLQGDTIRLQAIGHEGDIFDEAIIQLSQEAEQEE